MQVQLKRCSSTVSLLISFIRKIDYQQQQTYPDNSPNDIYVVLTTGVEWGVWPIM